MSIRLKNISVCDVDREAIAPPWCEERKSSAKSDQFRCGEVKGKHSSARSDRVIRRVIECRVKKRKITEITV